MQYELDREYVRPCAIIRMDDGRECAIPVFDHRHADPQFGFPHEHYHIDGRFYLEPRMGYEYQVHAGHTAAIIRMEDQSPQFLRIEERMVRCMRSDTGLLFSGMPTKKQQGNLERYARWYTSYVGRTCAGKHCPHYGTEMLEKDGRSVCPMHELTAGPETLRNTAR